MQKRKLFYSIWPSETHPETQGKVLMNHTRNIPVKEETVMWKCALTANKHSSLNTSFVFWLGCYGDRLNAVDPVFSPPHHRLLWGSPWMKKLPCTGRICTSICIPCVWVPRRKWLQHRLSAAPRWSWAGAQKCFLKNVLGVAGVANRQPFQPSLVSKFSSPWSDRYSFVSYFKPAEKFSEDLLCNDLWPYCSFVDEWNGLIFKCSNSHQNSQPGHQNWPCNKYPSNSETTISVICRRIRKCKLHHGQPGPVSRCSQSCTDISQPTSKGHAAFPGGAAAFPGMVPRREL